MLFTLGLTYFLPVNFLSRIVTLTNGTPTVRKEGRVVEVGSGHVGGGSHKDPWTQGDPLLVLGRYNGPDPGKKSEVNTHL